MENCITSGRDIEKFDIKLKSKPKDGVVLQLHHTVRGTNGECRRIRFSNAVFSDAQEKLACADNVGNLFILDFSDLKFWKLTDIGPCTALHFLPNKTDVIVTASIKKHVVNFLDIETGVMSLTLTGHTAPIKHISFSGNQPENMLTASPAEAILWELKNYTKYFTLNTFEGAQIQQILYNPSGEYLVGCFQNDTIQIWKQEGMKSVKQIIPSELRHLKSIAFTMNCRAMAMAGLTPMLILFNMDTWRAIKSVDLRKYGVSGIQQIAFIPQMFDGGANKILAMLSSDCKLLLLDLQSLSIVQTINYESSAIRKFVVSQTGKYFLCILQLGEVNIYNSSFVMETVQTENVPKSSLLDRPSSSKEKVVAKPKDSAPTTSEIEKRMRICMDSARLRRILMQYGEYPDKFRFVIWRSLLDTPRNKSAYISLVNKGIHPAFKDIEKQFTIHSTMTLNSLKRLLSCLAHWCPLFGVMKFLPGFVFPFVKVLQKDPLLMFESVVTIIYNHCQLWFEYAPFPPLCILAMVENILAEHDKNLLDFFIEMGVTSQTYALKILESAFSEVLTSSEWLILWDHILSNEPSFFLMAVVAYNIVQKNCLKKLKTQRQFEQFFHMQNHIDKKIFLKKIYVLLNDTPEDVHPRKFFKSFVTLDKGDSYQQFTGYPKATICLKLSKNERNRKRNSNRYSLKELSTRSLERTIKDRSKGDALGIKTMSDDDYEEVEIPKNKRNQVKYSTEIEERHKKDRDKVTKDIISHGTTEHHCRRIEKTRRLQSPSNIHPADLVRKSNLENEIKMILNNNSDCSD